MHPQLHCTHQQLLQCTILCRKSHLIETNVALVEQDGCKFSCILSFYTTFISQSVCWLPIFFYLIITMSSTISKSKDWMHLHLGILGQNAIWMWASWRGTKYTVRGKVVALPKSKPWWIMWVRVCPWLVLAPKMLKLCTNQLVVWFRVICVND
jgi:hypothetical protein